VLAIDENLDRVRARAGKDDLLQRNHEGKNEGFARSAVVGVRGNSKVSTHIPDLFTVRVNHYNF
jgi:hypothetical protein